MTKSHTIPGERPAVARQAFGACRARRGAALLLVLSVVSLAAVLGYAMLSMASLQRQMETNLRRGPEAEALAESGINLANYYLLHPQSAPGYPGWTDLSWHWPGTGGPVGFADAMGGSVDVVVAKDPARPWEYVITSTGIATPGTVSRTVTSRILLNAEYEVKYAAVFGSDVVIGSYGVIGALAAPTQAYARGAFTIRTNGKVYGNVFKGSALPSSMVQPVGGTFKTLPPVPVYVPADLTEIRDYRSYKLPGDDTTYHAQVHTPSGGGGLLDALLEPILGLLGIGSGGDAASLGPSATNPAGVHYVHGDVKLLANAQVQGTLIVTGKLIIEPGSSSISISSLNPKFPALIVANNIDAAPATSGGSLNIAGACWVGGKIDGGTYTNTSFNVNGALLCDGTLFASSPQARVNLKHRSDLVQIHDFTSKGRTPKSVRVISWREGR
jgi:hypothetical protein